MTHKFVLIRHGESQWNLENRFTGWTDVDLTANGLEEARRAGRLLRDEGFRFDLCYTSVLKRAIRTLWTILDEMDQMWLPVVHSWRLNERHYGNLQTCRAPNASRIRWRGWCRSGTNRSPRPSSSVAASSWPPTAIPSGH